MPEQVLKEIHLPYVVDEANKILEEEIQKFRENGFYIKQMCPSGDSNQRIFVLFEKYTSSK